MGSKMKYFMYRIYLSFSEYVQTNTNPEDCSRRKKC